MGAPVASIFTAVVVSFTLGGPVVCICSLDDSSGAFVDCICSLEDSSGAFTKDGGLGTLTCQMRGKKVLKKVEPGLVVRGLLGPRRTRSGGGARRTSGR